MAYALMETSNSPAGPPAMAAQGVLLASSEAKYPLCSTLRYVRMRTRCLSANSRYCGRVYDSMNENRSPDRCKYPLQTALIDGNTTDMQPRPTVKVHVWRFGLEGTSAEALSKTSSLRRGISPCRGSQTNVSCKMTMSSANKAATACKFPD